jgi:hypothetical protein
MCDYGFTMPLAIVSGMIIMLSIMLGVKGIKSYVETLVLIRENQIARENAKHDEKI